MRPATSPALLVLLLSAAVLASFVPVGRSRSIIGREEMPANNVKAAVEQKDSADWFPIIGREDMPANNAKDAVEQLDSADSFPIIGREDMPANNAEDAAEQLDSPEDEEDEFYDDEII